MICAEELADHLGVDDPSVADLDRLETLERSAVAFVQTWTGRYFGPVVEHTEILTGTGGPRLWLSDLPRPAEGEPLVTVKESPRLGVEPRPLTIDQDFAVLLQGSEAQLVRYLPGLGWPHDYVYEVSYRRGYKPGEEPADIRQIVIDLVAVKYSMIGREALRSESVGGYSYTRFGASDLDAVMGGAAALNIWRRPVVA